MFAKALGVACVAVAIFSAPVLAKDTDTQLKKRYQQTLEQAEAARAKAASIGGEWRDTESLLKSAAEAAKQGDLKKAIQLAEKGRRQGELGYQQAASQQSVGHPAYLR